MTLVHSTTAARVCVLALVLATARGFYATSLACCEKKCSAAGLDQEATTACRMHGCMMRWNGDTMSQCAARCMSQTTTSQKEACLSGCKNFAACNCSAGSYFSEPEAWASKGAKDTCRACPAGYACMGAQTAPAACKPGHWARAASKACLTCTAGRYGTGQSTTPQCSGTCAAGRFGRPGATSPQCHGGCVVKPGQYAIEAAAEAGCAVPCPAGRFGRGDSLDSHCSGACPAGRWSAAGSAACRACPAGTYGSSKALQTPECSGLCPAGRFSDDGATKCQDAKKAAQEAARKAKQEAAAANAKKERMANKLGGSVRTIRGQVGMTTCNSGEHLVCSTTIACKVSVGNSGQEQAANCPQSTQFAGHYVKLMTENCKCDVAQEAKAKTMPTILAPGQCKNGHQVVDDQWTGVGEGSNWCNHCLCSNGRLVCTTMTCSATKPTIAMTSTTPAPQSMVAAAKVAHFGSQCVNGATVVEDGWTGLGKAENAECKMCVCEAKKNVYVRCSSNECTARHTTASPTSLDWMTMCKLRDSTNSTKARFVPDGWTGPGLGKNWCNRCMCSKTHLSCTKMVCGADPNVCKNGHDTVPYGWIGRGKGAQWCNMCRCDEQHGIVCAPKVCGPNPSPTSETPSNGANVQRPPSDHDGCMNGAVRVADGWQGEGAGSKWCNRCNCAARKLSCQEQKTCPQRECNGVVCPAVAPTCLSPATMVKPKTAWAGCCFDETQDCTSATIVTTYAGRYVAMAPYLDNGGTMLVTRTEALCHAACLSSSDCIAGTYITSGTHKGECWLSSHVHKAARTCDKPCSSFAKRPGAPRTHPNLPVIQAKKAPETVIGAQCRCSPADAPASQIVDCKADVLGNHIRVHHLSTRFHHWKAQGNEGHVCKLVRVPTQSGTAQHGEHLCAQRNSLGDCIEYERFECRCCDCVPGGVPASIRMLGAVSAVSENHPLLSVAPGVNTLQLCAEECVKTRGCLAGDFRRDAGKTVCRLSTHIATSSRRQNGAQGFVKKAAVANGNRVVAVPISCGPGGCKNAELVNTKDNTAIELDANAGTYYAVEPYIGSGPSQEPDVQRCEARCAREKNCQVGTYITAGTKRGQCWLSAHALPRPLLCSSPCQSFGKRKLGVSGRSERCIAAFNEAIKISAGSNKCVQIVHHSLGAAKCDSTYATKEVESACNVAQQV